MEQFLKNYNFEIIPILTVKNDMDLLNSLGTSFKVIEVSFY